MNRILFITMALFSFLGFSQTPITASIAYQGYDESQAYLGQGEYQIFLDNVDGILDKPIIMVDGFDPGDDRNIANMYTSLNYDGSNIADILRNEGFDMVFVNFPTYTRAVDDIEVDGGVDFIQRNAMVLIELINQINNQKEGSQELVVIGPSMGGLISRYALRYMEQNNFNHETRLFVSFDSPHKGANIPIELQYLMNYFAEGFNGGDDTLRATVAQSLNNPASKEMLIDHYTSHLQSGSAYEQDSSLLLPVGADVFRNSFQNELDSMGFPEQCRNISIVNGASNGTATGTPGMEILNHTFDVPDVNNVTLEMILHFTPLANQSINVTTVNTWYAGSVLLASFEADSQSFSFSDGLDSAPGGTASIASNIDSGQGDVLLDEMIANLQQSDYCFIPTISAMAIEGEDDWYANVDSSQNIPFDAWIIPTVNEDHVTLTTVNMDFMLDEIRNGVANINQVNFDSIFKVKSNPVSNKITINTLQNYSLVDVSIIAITGQELVNKQFINIQNQISFPINLSNGIYFLKLKVNGQKFLKKIIVNNE